MATTYNYVGTPATTQYYGVGNNAYTENRTSISIREVSLPDAATAFGVSAFAANDVLKIFSVPANTWVHGVTAYIVTKDSTVTDSDVGDGDNVDGYIDGMTLAAAGVTSTSIGILTDTAPTTAYSTPVGGGKLYTSDDTIDWKLITAGAADGVVRFTMMSTYMGV